MTALTASGMGAKIKINPATTRPAITYYDRLSGKNEYVQIDPSTLSQLLYTNKQGVRFFDGDVVKHTYYEDSKVRVFFSEELLAVMGSSF